MNWKLRVPFAALCTAVAVQACASESAALPSEEEDAVLGNARIQPLRTKVFSGEFKIYTAQDAWGRFAFSVNDVDWSGARPARWNMLQFVGHNLKAPPDVDLPIVFNSVGAGAFRAELTDSRGVKLVKLDIAANGALKLAYDGVSAENEGYVSLNYTSASVNGNKFACLLGCGDDPIISLDCKASTTAAGCSAPSGTNGGYRCGALKNLMTMSGVCPSAL